MKHGGLAAKLDVVHWPLLVDTERKGRAGKGDPETTSQSLPPRVQPRPSSSSSLTDCQLCQVHGGARMQGCIQEVPGFCFVPGERLHPAPSSEQRKGKRCDWQALQSCEITLADPQTAPHTHSTGTSISPRLPNQQGTKWASSFWFVNG